MKPDRPFFDKLRAQCALFSFVQPQKYSAAANMQEIILFSAVPLTFV
jgi:hypothetical protein